MRVLVTGASGGLGTAVVDAFLRQGHTVAGVARSWPAAGDGLPAFQRIAADLLLPEECARSVAESGYPEVAVHVMGGFAGGQSLPDTYPAVWDRMLAINLHSAFHLFRAALPPMLAARNGRIVAVGSRAGVEPAAGLSAYGVSKAALIHLVRTVAEEVRGSGVTANAVLPSTIDTPANRGAMPDADFSKWVRPERIAETILWLASPAAGDINGAAIPIYGTA